MTNRPTLRAHYRSLRQRLDTASRYSKTLLIVQHLKTLQVLIAGKRIAAYLASPEETSIEAFFTVAWQREQSIFLPCIDAKQRHMTFAKHQPDGTLIKNRFGLMEPEDRSHIAGAIDLDCALVPLVAFDQHGSRLGMGGGYYDTFFAAPATRPTLIGIAFSEQQTTAPLPYEQWDVPLDLVVTDAAIHEFH